MSLRERPRQRVHDLPEFAARALEHAAGHAPARGLPDGFAGDGFGRASTREQQRPCVESGLRFTTSQHQLNGAAGLPLKGPRLGAARYMELMRVDKKAEGGEIRFVLIGAPGRAVTRAAPDALVREVLAAHAG